MGLRWAEPLANNVADLPEQPGSSSVFRQHPSVEHTGPVRLGALLTGGAHGDRLIALAVVGLVAGLLLTTCGPVTTGDELAAGLIAADSPDLEALAPEASTEDRALALQASDRDGDGKVDPDELDAFFAALLRAEREREAAESGVSTTIPAFVPPGEVMPPVDTDDPTLFMVGDSVLEASYPTVQRMLPSWDVLADTRVSRRPEEGAAIVEERSDEIGDVAVVLLGHNYGLGERFDEDFSRIMRELWRLERVVWVTVAEWSPGQDEVNELLRRAPELWPNVVIADWSALSAANPGYLSRDGVHLTPSGVLALSDLIARAVGPGPIPGVPGIVTVDVPAGPGGNSGGPGGDGPGPTPTFTPTTRPTPTSAPSSTTTDAPTTTAAPTTTQAPTTTIGEPTTVPEPTTTAVELVEPP
jgi:hypothetical protein